MSAVPLPSEQICVLLIIHGNRILEKQVNSYSIIRLLSRLFGIIDFAVVEALVTKGYLTKSYQQVSDYCLIQTGLFLLREYKSHLLEYLQAEGRIISDFSHDMTVHYIERI